MTDVIYEDETNLLKYFPVQLSEVKEMEVDENEGDIGARLRPIFCSLGEITRADGSVLLCQVVTNVKVYFDFLILTLSHFLGRYNCCLQCLWAR